MNKTRTFILWLAALLFAAAPSVSFSQLAPADEYFGRQHFSALVIRHRIFALKDDLHHARRQPGDVANAAADVQDALQDWGNRYPRDPWIAPAAWNLAILYEELPGTDAQKRAVALLQNVRDTYAGTPFGAYAERDLKRGIGVRPWPHWAVPPSDAGALVQSILALRTMKDPAQVQQAAFDLEKRYNALSRGGQEPVYARAAWELAALYERLPGGEVRDHAIRMLALLLDRYPAQTYGIWALRDLERGVGERR